MILLYEDLYTDVFPVFWSLIIAFFGPKSLCMGIIYYETEVKLIPLNICFLQPFKQFGRLDCRDPAVSEVL